MNHALKTGLRGSSRDIGLHTGAAGKGDADRTVNKPLYKYRFSEIHFPGVFGMVRKNGVARKVYPRF